MYVIWRIESVKTRPMTWYSKPKLTKLKRNRIHQQFFSSWPKYYLVNKRFVAFTVTHSHFERYGFLYQWLIHCSPLLLLPHLLLLLLYLSTLPFDPVFLTFEHLLLRHQLLLLLLYYLLLLHELPLLSLQLLDLIPVTVISSLFFLLFILSTALDIVSVFIFSPLLLFIHLLSGFEFRRGDDWLGTLLLDLGWEATFLFSGGVLLDIVFWFLVLNTHSRLRSILNRPSLFLLLSYLFITPSQLCNDPGIIIWYIRFFFNCRSLKFLWWCHLLEGFLRRDSGQCWLLHFRLCLLSWLLLLLLLILRCDVHCLVRVENGWLRLWLGPLHWFWFQRFNAALKDRLTLHGRRGLVDFN